jgi:hypothetical protein
VRELDLPSVGKVIVSTMQIIGNLSAALRIQFPKVFREILDMLLSVFRFDITFQLGIGCLADGSYAASLLANLALVLLVVALVGVLYIYDQFKVNRDTSEDNEEKQKEHVRKMFQVFDTNDDGIKLPEVEALLLMLDPTASAEVAAKIFAKADTNASGIIEFAEFYGAMTHPETGEALDMDLRFLVQRSEQNAVRATAVSRLFLLIFLLYPSLTNKIFQAFACRDFGPGISVLQADYTVDCGSAEYMGLWAFCSVLVLLWPIGMPTALFLAMYHVRDKINAGDNDTLETFGFVLGDYDSDHWYWEVCELARKLILAGLIGLVGRGSIAQAVVATIIAFFFFAVSVREQPYKKPTMNWIKLFSEFQIFAVLLMCVVLQAEAVGFETEVVTVEVYGAIQTVVTLAIVPVVLYFLVGSIRGLKAEAAHLQQDIQNDDDNPIFEMEEDETTSAHTSEHDA